MTTDKNNQTTVAKIDPLRSEIEGATVNRQLTVQNDGRGDVFLAEKESRKK